MHTTQTIKHDYDIRPLAAAVLGQAMREAKRDHDARTWLQSDGLIFFDVCGLNVDASIIQEWIKRGCKLPRRGGLRLGAQPKAPAYWNNPSP